MKVVHICLHGYQVATKQIELAEFTPAAACQHILATSFDAPSTLHTDRFTEIDLSQHQNGVIVITFIGTVTDRINRHIFTKVC